LQPAIKSPPASTTTVPIPLLVGPRATGNTTSSTSFPRTKLLDPNKLEAAIKALPSQPEEENPPPIKVPRRKPGARECMQISRRFGVTVIPEKHMKVLLDYCSRGKVEHLIRMRERLDCHSRYLESQIAGLEMLVQERGETDVVVPALPDCIDTAGRVDGSKQRTYSDAGSAEIIGTGTICSGNLPSNNAGQAAAFSKGGSIGVSASMQAHTNTVSSPMLSQTASQALSPPPIQQPTISSSGDATNPASKQDYT
jgi:hypothetical protein